MTDDRQDPPAPPRRPPSAREQQSRELGELLADPKVARAARLLQQVGLLGVARDAGSGDLPASATLSEGADARAPVLSEGPPREPVAISIWQPVEGAGPSEGEGVFRRPRPSLLGDHYAIRRELTSQRTPDVPRIAYFGESVAAGYLYAPDLTPATLLEQQLTKRRGGAVEVLDLARTNETLAGLVAKVRASDQLAPDAFVLFAGNNWNLLETPEVSAYAASVGARQAYARALRERGLEGPGRLAWNRLQQRVMGCLDAVARVAGGRPVVWVIPEVNLAHWHARQPPPWLPGDGCARWHALFEAGREALEQGDGDRALEIAAELEALDGGRVASTHRLAAEALGLLGRPSEAAQRGRAEIEAESYATLCCLGSPRIGPRLQDLLRQVGPAMGFQMVDLPRIFGEEDPWPGRRWFLDYCHLSAEGMGRVVASVADALMAVIAPPVIGSPQDGDPLAQVVGTAAASDVAPSVMPAVQARALVGAAVHGAHRLLTVGPKAPHLRAWLREAVEVDPAVVFTLGDLLEARTASVDAVLTVAHQRQMALAHGLTPQHGWAWDHLDADLWRSVYALLREFAPELAQEARRRLLERLAVNSSGRELTRPPYLWEPLERFFPEAMAPGHQPLRAMLRCPWPSVSFVLVVGEEGGDLELCFTARQPDPTAPAPSWEGDAMSSGVRGGPVTSGARGGPVPSSAPEGPGSPTLVGELQISLALEPDMVDDSERVLSLGAVPLAHTWSRRRVVVAGKDLSPGLHRLILRWPAPRVDGGRALESAVHRLEEGMAADLHPVFGELYSVHVKRISQGAEEASGSALENFVSTKDLRRA